MSNPVYPLVTNYEEIDFKKNGEIIRDKEMIRIAKKDVRHDFSDFINIFLDKAINDSFGKEFHIKAIQELREIFLDYNSLTIHELIDVAEFEKDIEIFNDNKYKAKQFNYIIKVVKKFYE